MRRGFLCRLSLLLRTSSISLRVILSVNFSTRNMHQAGLSDSPKRTKMFQCQSSHHWIYLIAALLLQRVDLQSCAHVQSCGGGATWCEGNSEACQCRASQLPRQTIEQPRNLRFLGLGVVQVKFRASPSSWLGLLYFRRSK